MNPSGKCSQERLTRGTVTSTMRRAAHPSGWARCGVVAGCLAITKKTISASDGAGRNRIDPETAGRSGGHGVE